MKSRPLTMLDIEILPDVVVETLGLTYAQSDKDLRDWDFIIGTVEIDGRHHQIIHGFPRDSHGAIFIEDDAYFVGAITGACFDNQYDRSVEDHRLQKWYSEVTKDGRDYENKFWRTDKGL
jgi:hypothetical protein